MCWCVCVYAEAGDDNETRQDRRSQSVKGLPASAYHVKYAVYQLRQNKVAL